MVQEPSMYGELVREGLYRTLENGMNRSALCRATTMSQDRWV